MFIQKSAVSVLALAAGVATISALSQGVADAAPAAGHDRSSHTTHDRQRTVVSWRGSARTVVNGSHLDNVTKFSTHHAQRTTEDIFNNPGVRYFVGFSTEGNRITYKIENGHDGVWVSERYGHEPFLGYQGKSSKKEVTELLRSLTRHTVDGIFNTPGTRRVTGIDNKGQRLTLEFEHRQDGSVWVTERLPSRKAGEPDMNLPYQEPFTRPEADELLSPLAQVEAVEANS
jgi:hypothetical protein